MNHPFRPEQIQQPETNREPGPGDGQDQDYRVNFFRPRRGYMRQEVIGIWVMLILWAMLTLGFQFVVLLGERNPAGEGALTDLSVFGFPFHYWFTAQFVIVCFIFLCLIFNLFIDHLTGKYRKRR